METTFLAVSAGAKAVFEGLPDNSLRRIVYEAIQNATSGPNGIPARHLREGQSGGWERNNPEYDRRKGGKPMFVKSGRARDGVLNPNSPYRKVTVRRLKDGVYVGKMTLYRRGPDGRNVYDFVQGKRRGASGPGRVGKKPLAVTDVRPGDDELMRPHLEAAAVRELERLGVL